MQKIKVCIPKEENNWNVDKFTASVPVVIDQAAGVKDLKDEAYSKKVDEGIIGGPNNYRTISNSFSIIPMKLLPPINSKDERGATSSSLTYKKIAKSRIDFLLSKITTSC